MTEHLPDESSHLVQEPQFYETLVTQSQDGIIIIDDDGVVQFANPAARQMFAGRAHRLVGFHLGTPAIDEPVEMVLPGGTSALEVEMRATEIEWAGSKATLATLRDISLLKQTVSNLHKRIMELECLMSLGEFAADTSLDERAILTRTAELLPSAMKHRQSAVVKIAWEDSLYQAGSTAQARFTLRVPLESAEKNRGFIEVGYTEMHPETDEGPFQAEEHKFLLAVAARLVSILEHKSVMSELEFHSRLINAVGESVIATEPDGKIVFWNQGAVSTYGWRANEVMGRNIMDVTVPENARSSAGKIMQSVNQWGRWSGEFTVKRKSGERFPAIVSNEPIYSNEGKPIAVIGVSRDVSTRQQEARERETLMLAIEQVPEAILITNHGGIISFANSAFLRLTDNTLENLAGQHYKVLELAADKPGFVGLCDKLDQPALWKGSITSVNDRGTNHDNEAIISPVHNSRGQLIGHVAAIRDVSVEASLTRQLHHAQKLEAVGQLAGGVAHDFNNMLGLILGNAEIALDQLNQDDVIFQDIRQIIEAADRAANITRQLLAFARKQNISPRTVDLKESVVAISNMLARLIGEHISLTMRTDSATWPVYMDPVQLDQILANLVINARDAIEGEGRIEVSTGNASIDEAYTLGRPDVEPGDYTVLSVTDNGVGMEKSILSNIFEPFFTTKATGKGSGLGLSTVYGIVKQNSGFIDVESEPGRGTTFSIFLPRYESHTPAATIKPREIALPTGDETILVVEDLPDLLKLARRYLIKLGYKVLATTLPEEAFEIVAGHDVDLLLVDVLLPQMTGPVLYQKLQQRDPTLRCVYMSGYSADALAQDDVSIQDIHFLEKPFTLQRLANKVREALERGR